MTPAANKPITVARSLGRGNWGDDDHEAEIHLGGPQSEKNALHDKKIIDNDHADDAWSQQQVDAVSRLWELDKEQRDKLITLGRQLQDPTHACCSQNAPQHVIRFLYDQAWNVDAAQALFRKSMQWRKQVQADSILQDCQRRPPRAVIENFPGSVLQGVDKEGDPIFVDLIVEADCPAILDHYGDAVGQQLLLEHAIWLRELVGNSSWVDEYEREMGHPPRLFTIITDLSNISRRHVNRKVLKIFGEIMRLDQENYPGCAKRIILIRAPVVFRVVWGLVKHFFEPHVADKMIFCGRDNYQQILAEYVDLKVLPSVLVPEGRGKARAGLPQNFVAVPIDGSSKE